MSKTSEYDEMWAKVDAHIAQNRIYKDVDIDQYIQEADQKIEDIRGKLPEPSVEPSQQKWALKQDWKRPWGGNDYMFCPEMYCTAVKRRLETELGEFFENYPDGIPEKPWFTTFPPAEMIPYHDAIFDVDDQPEMLDPRPEPKKKRNWWDKEAIAAEFNEFDPSALSAARRVDWYLRQTEKAEEKSDYVPLEYQDSSWPDSMKDSCGFPQDDEYSLQQYASGSVDLDLY